MPAEAKLPRVPQMVATLPTVPAEPRQEAPLSGVEVPPPNVVLDPVPSVAEVRQAVAVVGKHVVAVVKALPPSGVEAAPAVPAEPAVRMQAAVPQMVPKLPAVPAEPAQPAPLSGAPELPLSGVDAAPAVPAEPAVRMLAAVPQTVPKLPAVPAEPAVLAPESGAEPASVVSSVDGFGSAAFLDVAIKGMD